MFCRAQSLLLLKSGTCALYVDKLRILASQMKVVVVYKPLPRSEIIALRLFARILFRKTSCFNEISLFHFLALRRSAKGESLEEQQPADGRGTACPWRCRVGGNWPRGGGNVNTNYSPTDFLPKRVAIHMEGR